MTPGPGRTIAVASAGVSQAQRMHGQRIRRSTGETSRFGSLTDVTGPPGQHRDLARLGACFRSGEGRPSGPTPSRSCPCRRRGRRRCSRRHRIYPGGSPGLEAQVRDTRLFARNCSSRGDRSPSRLITIILFNSREQSERDGALRRRPSGAGSRRGWSTPSEVHARPGLTDRLFSGDIRLQPHLRRPPHEVRDHPLGRPARAPQRVAERVGEPVPVRPGSAQRLRPHVVERREVQLGEARSLAQRVRHRPAAEVAAAAGLVRSL